MPTEHDETPADPAEPAVRDRPAQPSAAPHTASPRTAERRIGPVVTPAPAEPPRPADDAGSRDIAACARPETDPGTAVPSATGRTRIVFTEDGPALVDGPVELVTADGAVIHADRFLVAFCLCKRSQTYPLCDTSHRRQRRCGR